MVVQTKEEKLVASKKYYGKHRKEKQAYSKKYHQEHREKLAEYNKRYRQNHKAEIIAYRQNRKDENREKQKKWEEKHRDERISYQKKWYHENKEKVSIQSKKYNEENKEKIATQRKKYRYQHKKEQSIYSKKYQREHPEVNRRTQHKRRLKKLQLIESYTSKEWNDKVDATNGICLQCGGKYEDVHPFCATLDHIPSISIAPVGFCYTINDVSPICGICNRSNHVHSNGNTNLKNFGL